MNTDLFLVVWIAACAAFLVRNDFVYRARVALLNAQPVTLGLALHGALPAYSSMLANPKYWTLWTPKHWLAWVERHQGAVS